MKRGDRQGGFTYVALLFALAVFGLGAAWIGETSSRTVQRERERELVRIGLQIQAAIRSYYLASPGSVRNFPRSFDELEFDSRYVGVKRHLRRLERDPIANSFDWGVIKALDGGIAGVYSPSDARPLTTPGVTIELFEVPPGNRYSNWTFAYVPK